MTGVLHLPTGTDSLQPWCDAGVLSAAHYFGPDINRGAQGL